MFDFPAWSDSSTDLTAPSIGAHVNRLTGSCAVRCTLIEGGMGGADGNAADARVVTNDVHTEEPAMTGARLRVTHRPATIRPPIPKADYYDEIGAENMERLRKAVSDINDPQRRQRISGFDWPLSK